jgi:hypothetical protein
MAGCYEVFLPDLLFYYAILQNIMPGHMTLVVNNSSVGLLRRLPTFTVEMLLCKALVGIG